MAESVVNCEPTVMSILKAYKKINMKSFKLKLKKVSNPYYLKNTSKKISDKLSTIKIPKSIKKDFIDIKF